jgi:hypothetical protein
MCQEIGRRAFVGSVIAGVPLLVDRPSLLAQSPAASTAAARGGSLDPFIEFTVRGLAAIQRRAHDSHSMHGEQARAAAQQIRGAIVYLQGQRLDDDVERVAAAAVAANGRDALMYPEVDGLKALAAMRQFGLALDAFPDTTGVDFTTRAALVDDLSKTGVTPMLSRIADTLATASAELDRRAAAVTSPIVRVQDTAWWNGFCSSLTSTIAQLQAEAYMMALLSWFAPDMLGAYYLVQAAIGVDYGTYVALCVW